MRRKSKKMSDIALLEAEGILLPKDKTTNPINTYNRPASVYKNIWRVYDINQYCAYLKWENLPNGLTSWLINRMLYFRGSLVGFKRGGKIYILPYVIKGDINIYGLPNAVQPIAFNGRAPGGANGDSFFGESFNLPIDMNGDANNTFKACLLYDSVPLSPTSNSPSRHILNDVIINDIADTMARININIVVSNKKIMLIVKDPAMKDIVQKELEDAFSSDCPFAVLTSELDVDEVQNTSDLNADELFNTIKNYDAIRCFMSGISSKNFGTEKKERLVSGELDGNDEQINLIADMRLELAQLFAKQMNEAFNLNISVTARRDEYEETTNGNNQTEERVEELL